MENNISEIKTYIHKVHYYETDKMGIVHHSNYIRWFEEARTAFLEDIGLGYDKLEKEGIISPVTSVNCEYKTMVRFGESVYIIPKLESFNGIRMKISYSIFDVFTGELRTSGTSEHCFLDINNKIINLKKFNTNVYETILKYIGYNIKIN